MIPTFSRQPEIKGPHKLYKTPLKNKKLIFISLLFPILFFFNLAAAQVPVQEESHHKVVFENEYVRLLEGRISVHDTTPPHIHAANSVVVFLSKSTFGIQVTGEKPVVTEVSPGDLKYAAYGDKPVTHIVWNQGKSMFHFMVAELVNQHPASDTCSINPGPGVKFQWQQKLVSAYTLDITNSRPYHLPKSNCAYLLIGISGNITTISHGNKHSLQTGSFVFFPSQNDIDINSGNQGNAGCVLLELK